MPNAAPVLLGLLALTALGLTAASSHAKPPPAKNTTPIPPLDSSMPDATKQAVTTALATETDPAALTALAATLQSTQPTAAQALLAKAAALTAAQHAAQATQAASQGIAPQDTTHATPAAATTAATPPTAQPQVVTATPLPASAPMPSGPGTWTPATDADVQRDGTSPRFKAFLAQSVGTQAIETHGGNVWEFRVVSKTTDPGLTTYAKDVRAWIWRPGVQVPGATVPLPSIPVVTPHTISTMASSPAIAAVQGKLNQLGQSPPLAVDGINGPLTIGAVKAFQSTHGLTVDGIAGPRTNAALDAAIAQGTATPAPINLAPVTVTPRSAAVSPPVTLKDVQAALNTLGQSPPLTIDGLNGPLTQAAVKAFQTAHGLTVDGIAGPQTKAAIASDLSALSNLSQVSAGRHRLSPFDRPLASGRAQVVGRRAA
jgi:peptidoglycan hydrolase-like protein with peptidoglycan-binding domain